MTVSLRDLTREWGPYRDVALYLNRCQVDTPSRVVKAVWQLISERRNRVAKVVDFGAGDGRFARTGDYLRYIGYEIDSNRSNTKSLPANATLLNQCAFSARVEDADVCIGNPPYVRNQDLPEGWRVRAAQIIHERIGVEVSGLANAWQYFTMLALASTKPDGLVALVIPYEWVSRPSAKTLRNYVKENGWEVSVYRLRDETFHRVLTTSSIAIIDKSATSGKWRYFEETINGEYKALASPSGGQQGVLSYSRRTRERKVFAKRGLSPGTQEVLTLTEEERVCHRLRIGVDVVPCITSMRHITPNCSVLSETTFRKFFREAGAKCWLLRTNRKPSKRLAAYLRSVPKGKRCTRTCTDRKQWWKFTMPTAAAVFVASGFREAYPKAVRNNIGAVAVGGVSGIYGLSDREIRLVLSAIRSADFSMRVVAHSNGLRKLEIGQIETFLAQVLPSHTLPSI